MRHVRAMIAAVSPEGAIGLDGRIPWHYSTDLKRFKRLTAGATVIMGRRTWESMGSQPLPGRRNIVITSRDLPAVPQRSAAPPNGAASSPRPETFPSIEAALATCADEDVWFIGGAGIYAAAMAFADRIELTYVPDLVADSAAVRFPPIDPAEWTAGPRVAFRDDSRLERQTFSRRRPSAD